MNLADQKCAPCHSDDPVLGDDKVNELLLELAIGWIINDKRHLYKEFYFDDFMSALNFGNSIGEIAEAEGHHPDLLIAWGKCGIEIWTHKIKGLSDADFVLAAKIDRYFRSQEE